MSLAAKIEEELDISATTEPGSSGQFDVVADGEVIASREGGFFKKLLGGGWPDPDEVVEELRKRVAT